MSKMKTNIVKTATVTNIDWSELSKQYVQLETMRRQLEKQDLATNHKSLDALEGVLNMIDELFLQNGLRGHGKIEPESPTPDLNLLYAVVDFHDASNTRILKCTGNPNFNKIVKHLKKSCGWNEERDSVALVEEIETIIIK